MRPATPGAWFWAVWIGTAAVLRGGEPSAPDEPHLARELCRAYRAVETVYCEIRKVTAVEGRTPVRMLSCVTYRRPDRIHVENAAPVRRRIIADGQTLYYYEQGLPRGFSRPISKLDPEWLAMLRTVPGTPMEHLQRLQDLPETRLPAADFPLRALYRATNTVVVLSCDDQKRPVRIEYFASEQMTNRLADCRYGDFRDTGAGCWIPCRHEAVRRLPDGTDATERRFIHNLEVNGPVDPALFDVRGFLPEVEFVDEFRRTYQP